MKMPKDTRLAEHLGMVTGRHLVKHESVSEQCPAKLSPSFSNIVLDYFATEVFASLVNVGKATGGTMGKDCVGRILMFIGAMFVVPDKKYIWL
jgi:hypothetical protein